MSPFEGRIGDGRRALFLWPMDNIMTDKHEPRLFPDDAAIRRVGEGMT